MNLVGVGIAVLVLAVVAFAFLYSPGPPSYTLAPTSLTIRDRFYPVTMNGQKARMYWASGKRFVLLPPKRQGSAVLLEVNRPDEFVRELRRVWSAAG